MAAPYPGNVPSNVSKDAKYSVVTGSEGWEVRLIYRLSSSERALVTTRAHGELVEMVNSVKEEVNGVPGGAFYINEYRHVLVPTSEGCLFAGRYAALLRFKFEGQEITPEAVPGLEPGDDWLGPRVGTAYVLSADGTDIRYRVETRPQVTAERRLSSEVGKGQASKTARRLSRYKPGGGRIYVNEARECFGHTSKGNDTNHTYLGHVEADEWVRGALGVGDGVSGAR